MVYYITWWIMWYFNCPMGSFHEFDFWFLNNKSLLTLLVLNLPRYENLWLPLLANEGSSSQDPFLPLIPPLDCAWIWHVHRLNPVSSLSLHIPSTSLGHTDEPLVSLYQALLLLGVSLILAFQHLLNENLVFWLDMLICHPSTVEILCQSITWKFGCFFEFHICQHCSFNQGLLVIVNLHGFWGQSDLGSNIMGWIKYLLCHRYIQQTISTVISAVCILNSYLVQFYDAVLMLVLFVSFNADTVYKGLRRTLWQDLGCTDGESSRQGCCNGGNHENVDEALPWWALQYWL